MFSIENVSILTFSLGGIEKEHMPGMVTVRCENLQDLGFHTHQQH